MELIVTPAPIEPHPVRLLHIKVVCERTSLSRSTVLKLCNEGAFPKPVKLGDLRVAFVESEVLDWISARIAERDAKACEDCGNVEI